MIITRIWRQQPGKWFCISTKDSNKRWEDHFFSRREFKDVPSFLRENSDKDLYFCPHGFSRDERKKQYAVTPTLLWSDMDEADPRKVKFKPTIAIESSPGRYVGLWMLTHDMNESINRRLSYAIGGDPGGWDLTQVLRIPGTTNYKYQTMPRVRILWSDGPTWSDIDKHLPEEVVEETETTDASEAFKRWRKKMPHWLARELSTRRTPPAGKRSEMLFKLANTLFEMGVPEEDGIAMIRASVWNKFSGRRNELTQLRREWDKATNKHFQASKPVAGEDDHGGEGDYVYLAHSVADVEERDLDWVWYPYLARGEVTILQGDPEAGKSFISQNVSGAICVGSELPCYVEGFKSISGRVAYFDIENSIETVTKRRLRWNGFDADAQRNFFQEERPFSVEDEEELEKVYDALERVKPALIVFDTLNTYVGKIDTNSGAQAQQSFLRFKEMARRFNCAVLVLRHLTKGGRDRAMYRGQGNIAFTGVARIELTAGVHPEDPSIRVMARSKGNLTKPPPALTYEIIDRGDRRERDRSKFEWGEFDVELTAEQIVAPPDKKDPKEKNDAKAFLLEVLGNGRVEAQRVERMAESRSISQRTLYRARQELNVLSDKTGYGKERITWWSLNVEQSR